jgi:hypothetical protein
MAKPDPELHTTLPSHSLLEDSFCFGHCVVGLALWFPPICQEVFRSTGVWSSKWIVPLELFIGNEIHRCQALL